MILSFWYLELQAAVTRYPAEAEYWRALFIRSSPISIGVPCPMSTVALLNGKTLGFGAPPAREMRDGGDFCINSARVKGKHLGYNLIITMVIISFNQYLIIVQRTCSIFQFTCLTIMNSIG